MAEEDKKTMAEFQEKLEEMLRVEVARRIGDQYFMLWLGMGDVSDYKKRRCREEVLYLLRRAVAEIR